MLRDNRLALIEPMFEQRGSLIPLALLHQTKPEHRTMDLTCLENPRPEGRNFDTSGERHFSISG